MKTNIFCDDCENYLENKFDILSTQIDLTFLDPPFNQGKQYSKHFDSMPENEYWDWMQRICSLVYNYTSKGGAVYFMHREKNVKFIIDVLENSGWIIQDLIIWKKKTSAVPMKYRYGKCYQIIIFAIKGNKPTVFNRMKIEAPYPPPTYKMPRGKNGRYVTNIWEDIRELTSGYFAGKEPLRDNQKKKIHCQQSPIRLLARIILSSSNVGDLVFDPFVGVGTTSIVAKQLQRNSIGIDLDPKNVEVAIERVHNLRECDNLLSFRSDYKHTKNLNQIWPVE